MSKRIPLRGHTLLAGVALVGAVVVIVAGANLALGSGATQSNEAAKATATVTPVANGTQTTQWPRNAAGYTYGSAALAKSYWDEPDLIGAEATNGNAGYAFKKDLENPIPVPGPELDAFVARGAWTEKVPVYDADGVTQIGVFVVWRGAMPAPEAGATAEGE